MSDSVKKNAEQLLASNFNKTGAVVEQLSDPLVITPMLLTLEQIKPYDRNPRHSRNPKYDDIKASIKERGLDTPPPVTRRPGDGEYMIRNGGNTRLEILWELWNETKNDKFFKIYTLFHPWTGEVTLLTGHLVEDELHGRLTYIDRAMAVVNAAEVYKAEIGMTFTQAQLAQKLTHDGYPISQPTVSHMIDTVNYLLPVIPEQLQNGMSRTLVQSILRLRKIAKAIWIKKSKENNIDSDESYNFDNLFTEVLSQYNQELFELSKYQDELIGRIANVFECGYELIELEFTEKLARQRSLETPSISTEDDFDEASLFTNKALNSETQDIELDENQILSISAPKRPISPKVVNVTQRIETDETINSDKNPEDYPTENIIHTNNEFFDGNTSDGESIQQQVNENNTFPVETTPRLEQIQQLINQYNKNPEPDFNETVIQAIPVQAGGLSPITDIWYIDEVLNNIDVLRQHIGQLLLEITKTISDEPLIECIGDQFGFKCIKSSSDNKSVQTFIDLLQAFTGQSRTNENITFLNLVSFLTGEQSINTEIVRLDDTSFIKLMRVLRLIRQYVEITE